MTWTNARVAAALLANLLVATLLATGCGAEPAIPPPSAPAGAGTPSSAQVPTGEPRALPIYYVTDTPAGFRLYREFHRVTTTDPASDAVREMLAEPTGEDPDYRTLWPDGTALRVPVTAENGVITVDLTPEASGPAMIGSEAAELTVQQLVFTVHGALQSTDPVRLLVDGVSVAELWGSVSTADPVRRADQYAVRSLVQIDAPVHGARVGRTVEVSGEAAVFEATVPWEILRGDTVVQSGFTMSAQGQRFAPFSFTVTLEPGEYMLQVTEDDPSDGEGRPPFTDPGG